MPTLFTRIVRGEIPAHRVHEDDRHLAFLDIRPITQGHTLVIPKREVAYLFDLPPEEHAALWAFTRTVADGVKRATGCARVVVAVVGWEVPHVHVHLVPTDSIGDFPFPAARLEPTGDELADAAASIRAALG